MELRQRPHVPPPLSPSRVYRHHVDDDGFVPRSGTTAREFTGSTRSRGGRVPPERMQSFTPPEQEEDQLPLDIQRGSPFVDDLPAAESSGLLADASRSRRRRDSTPSSVFAILPSNMSMLMNEEGDDEQLDGSGVYSTASPPASPTLVLPLLPKQQSQQSYQQPHASPRRLVGHVADKSISSLTGNISPTTANFSMMSTPGSPGSLNLRPEHEQHLGDMITLNLDGDGSEDDGAA